MTLNSGRLLITLFFYEAKVNKPRKNRMKILKSVTRSIPFSSRNKEFEVRRHAYQGASYRAPNTRSPIRQFFNYFNETKDTFHSQRFFLFFFFLGLDPGNFLLEFYLKIPKHVKTKKQIPVKRYVHNKRFNRNLDRIFIHQFEFTILFRIFRYLNSKVFFS
jgi:hypothetical protein